MSSFTLSLQLLPAIRRIFLVVVTFALTIVPAHATILNVTLSDVVMTLLGVDFPVTGGFVYDTAADKILRANIESRSPIFFYYNSSFGPNSPPLTAPSPLILGPGFAFLHVREDYVPDPPNGFPFPPDDGCSARGPTDIPFTSLCLIPTEPVTSPGQDIPLALYPDASLISFGIAFGDTNLIVSGSLVTESISERNLRFWE